MIKVSKENKEFHFEVEGLHKLWSFKSSLSIPEEHIVRAYQNIDELNEWKGWRMPGTYIPYLITAGTFYLDGKKIFWDVVDKSKAIIIELKDQDFQKLVIEVEDPQTVLELLGGE